MKKIRLPQPYAGLVICGLLKRIPYIWNKYKKDEPIFIYAEKYDSKSTDKPSVSNEIYKMLQNGKFMGNVTNSDLRTGVYLGYVMADYLSAANCTWLGGDMESLYVHSPNRFLEKVNEFDTSCENLMQRDEHPVCVKKMERSYSHLTIPVGHEVWRTLHNWNGSNSLNSSYIFDELFMFVEDNMKRCLYDGSNREITISRVTFRYRNNIAVYNACGTKIETITYRNKYSKENDQALILSFILKYIPKDKRNNNIKEFCNVFAEKLRKVDEDLKSRPTSEPFNIIYIPMGKMNKRR